jgi:hypothetical protein
MELLNLRLQAMSNQEVSLELETLPLPLPISKLLKDKVILLLNLQELELDQALLHKTEVLAQQALVQVPQLPTEQAALESLLAVPSLPPLLAQTD